MKLKIETEVPGGEYCQYADGRNCQHYHDGRIFVECALFGMIPLLADRKAGREIKTTECLALSRGDAHAG